MDRSLTATLKYAQTSQKKMEVPADIVRGMDVSKALIKLKHMTNRSADILSKVVKSALANATNNAGYDEENLYIDEIKLWPAPKIKRISFESRGRIKNYEKHQSFVKVILDIK